MRHVGLNKIGRLATIMAAIFAPPYKARTYLARMNRSGYVAPSAEIHHPKINFGSNVFIGDRVIIHRSKDGGPLKLGDKVVILRDTIIEIAEGGSVSIGAETYIHQNCQLIVAKNQLKIGARVMIAGYCSFYPHDHGFVPNEPIRIQPLVSKGPIVIGDDAWLGTGVIVLGGVEIGEGAVIGAGSVVTKDVPKNGLAYGVPARVVKMRDDLRKEK